MLYNSRFLKFRNKRIFGSDVLKIFRITKPWVPVSLISKKPLVPFI